jgi:hypothetical protein
VVRRPTPEFFLTIRVILSIIDLVLLQHKFEIEHKDGSKETRTSTLCEYGAPIGSGGYSAMAKLVGVPCGVGKLNLYPKVP